MRFLNRLALALAMVLCLCFASEAKAQCNSGFATNGFSAFSFGGPAIIPFNGGFVGPTPINSFNFFAAGNHGLAVNNGFNSFAFSNRRFNVNSGNGFNSFNFNGGRRGGFNVQSAGGNGNTNFIRLGPFGRPRVIFNQSN